MKKITVVLFVWASTAFITFGALNAKSKFDCVHLYPELLCCREARSFAGLDAALSLVPAAGPLVGFFMTGFYEHGFDWKIGCLKAESQQ